jgi:hypothetical protein
VFIAVARVCQNKPEPRKLDCVETEEKREIVERGNRTLTRESRHFYGIFRKWDSLCSIFPTTVVRQEECLPCSCIVASRLRQCVAWNTLAVLLRLPNKRRTHDVQFARITTLVLRQRSILGSGAAGIAQWHPTSQL